MGGKSINLLWSISWLKRKVRWSHGIAAHILKPALRDYNFIGSAFNQLPWNRQIFVYHELPCMRHYWCICPENSWATELSQPGTMQNIWGKYTCTIWEEISCHKCFKIPLWNYNSITIIQQHASEYYAINLWNADLWLCRTCLSLEEVTRKFYKDRDLQFVNWSHNIKMLLEWW